MEHELPILRQVPRPVVGAGLGGRVEMHRPAVVQRLVRVAEQLLQHVDRRVGQRLAEFLQEL